MENLGFSSSAPELGTSQQTIQAFCWTLAGHNRRCPCCSPRRNRWTSCLRVHGLDHLSQHASQTIEDMFLDMDLTVVILKMFTRFNTIIEIIESYTNIQQNNCEMRIFKQNVYACMALGPSVWQDKWQLTTAP